MPLIGEGAFRGKIGGGHLFIRRHWVSDSFTATSTKTSQERFHSGEALPGLGDEKALGRRMEARTAKCRTMILESGSQPLLPFRRSNQKVKGKDQYQYRKAVRAPPVQALRKPGALEEDKGSRSPQEVGGRPLDRVIDKVSMDAASNFLAMSRTYGSALIYNLSRL